MDSYTRRATRAFTAMWSFIVFGIAFMGVLVGAITEPMPDWFAIVYPIIAAFSAGVCGFFHGITLSAARRLDEANADDAEESSDSYCYTEYCQGGCGYRHSWEKSK